MRRKPRNNLKRTDHQEDSGPSALDASHPDHPFHRFAAAIAHWAGSPVAFMAAVGVVVVWILLGPAAHYSDTWQLVINTGTTIVTFLMVFLIQNSQNRDSRAMHLKLDEVIRSIESARNTMVDLEDASDEELEHLQREFQRMRGKSRST